MAAQHYHVGLVFLSYIVASLASYSALDLSRRVLETRGRNQLFWIISAGVVMGIGIWSMHFIAMLALILPVAMEYRLSTVIISVILAILGPMIALYIVEKVKNRDRGIIIGAFPFASGIVFMHYIGMAAMIFPGKMVYNGWYVTASCIIAIVASYVALRLAYVFANASGFKSVLVKIAAALVMGIAVAGMHYTGMAGTTFYIMTGHVPMPNGSHMEDLATIVGVTSIMVLLSAVIGAVANRRFESNEVMLRRSNERFRSLYVNNLDAVLTFSMNAHCIEMNQRAIELIGAFEIGIEGRQILDRIHPDDQAVVYEAFMKSLAGETTHYEFRIESQDKKLIGSAMNVPILDAGIVSGLFVIIRDITVERTAMDALNHLALHDPLTNLPNRHQFESFVDNYINQPSDVENKQLYLLFLDIDRFKYLNDSLGHVFGDRLLMHVGAQLQSQLSHLGTVARMGGDEFIISIVNQPKYVVEAVADKIMQWLQEPLSIDGRTVYVTASIGISVFPEDGPTRSALLQNADIAMYEAKAAGRNTYRFYQKSNGETASNQLQVEQELREATKTGQFKLVYQPKVDIQSGDTVGFEALLRWPRNSGKFGSPAEFIPIAEETGLIVPIGEWVLRTAIQQAKEWEMAGIPTKVAVNFAAQQVADREMLPVIKDALNKHQLSTEYLAIELTESSTMNEATAGFFLNACREWGIHLDLDDFGTGYSSLSRLARLPFDLVKIDMSFVRNIVVDPKSRALVRSIIDIAHNLGMRCLAEGVETEEQLLLLKSLGCDEAQGYYFSKPLPDAAATEWLLARKRESFVSHP